MRTSRSLSIAWALLATGATLPPCLAAQEAAPRLPFGVPAVVLPVQRAVPGPGGAWPAGSRSEEEAARALDAELAFALGERRGAEAWALPEAVRRRVARNPTIGVDPDRLAYQGLLAAPDRWEQIYEPLHGQLRTLAALFGTRYVVLPLALSVSPPEPGIAGCKSEGAERGELLLALIDIRRSAVLWHGTITGRPACLDSGALLALLAARVAAEITDS